MRVRTPVSAAIAAALVTWLVAPIARCAEEVAAAASATAEARTEPSGSLDGRPGLESGRYRRILIAPLHVAYSNDPGSRRRHDRSPEIDPSDLRRFRRYYREAIEKQLGEAHRIATAPSVDVLQIDTVLLDPVVDKSAWNAAAKNVYSDLQTMRLVVLLRDSRTGGLLRRVELPVRVGTSRWSERNAVTYWGQVRLVFAQVAKRVQWAIEDAALPTSF